MSDTHSTDTDTTARRPRLDITAILEAFLDTDDSSLRDFARQRTVPASTLRHWVGRHRAVDLHPDIARFFDSTPGLLFLHRLVVALHLVFALQNGVGIRPVCQFLRLCRLDRFVAASYGSRQRFAAALEQAVGDFAATQRQQSAEGMPARDIAVAEDETFHPATCLVAIEPVSGFLLVEVYAERRDAATWDAALKEALAGLPLTVAVQVSDEAKGLLAHARAGLGVPHSPDLFHVGQELSRAVGPALAAQAREAVACQGRVALRLAEARSARAAATGQPRPVGRPIDHDERVRAAEQLLAGCGRCVEQCQTRQARARQAIRGLGDDDHPFDLATGQAVEAEAVRQRLEGRLASLETLANEARLSEGNRERLGKARRVLPGLVAAVAFFWVRLRAASLASYGAEAGWVERLVAGMYLRVAAGKARCAGERRRLQSLAQECVSAAHVACGEPPGGWALAESRAREWAGWFQRSSSCVEGRNGVLSLHHHGLHRLGGRRLRALTALHNYWVRGRAGTTAAERFFGRKPGDLFEHLLEVLPLPARPAARRPRAA
jgi:hypothetical protein